MTITMTCPKCKHEFHRKLDGIYDRIKDAGSGDLIAIVRCPKCGEEAATIYE